MVVPLSKAGHQRVTHPFATVHLNESKLLVRLACIKHTASVHPEPGSNSPFDSVSTLTKCGVSEPINWSVKFSLEFKTDVYCHFNHYSVVKEHARTQTSVIRAAHQYSMRFCLCNSNFEIAKHLLLLVCRILYFSLSLKGALLVSNYRLYADQN